MSREGYVPPSLQPQGSNYGTTAIGDATTQYLCGECNAKVQLKKGDPIRCKDCGHRVLYKERTKRSVKMMGILKGHDKLIRVTGWCNLKRDNSQQLMASQTTFVNYARDCIAKHTYDGSNHASGQWVGKTWYKINVRIFIFGMPLRSRIKCLQLGFLVSKKWESHILLQYATW